MFIQLEFEQNEERLAEYRNAESGKYEETFDKSFPGFEPFKGLNEPSYSTNLKVS